MSKFESKVKEINYPQSMVYAKLSDMNNLASIVEKLKDPAVQDKLKQQVPEDKLKHVQENLDSLKFDSDSLSFTVQPVGEMGIHIIEREPDKCIKFESVKSPVNFKLWIQILPVTSSTSKLRVTVDASLNPFLSMMVSKPLSEGVEKMADMMAMIPYGV